MGRLVDEVLIGSSALQFQSPGILAGIPEQEELYFSFARLMFIKQDDPLLQHHFANIIPLARQGT
jgi:hypothetical protein